MLDPFKEYEDRYPSTDFLELSDELTERLTYALLDSGYLTPDYQNRRSIPVHVLNYSRGKEGQNGKGVWEGIIDDILAARQMKGEYISPEEHEEMLAKAKLADLRDINQRDAASVSQCSCYIELKFDEGVDITSNEVRNYFMELYTAINNITLELGKEAGLRATVLSMPVPGKRGFVYQAICFDSRSPRVDIYKC